MRGKNHDPDFDDRMMEYSEEDSDDEPVPKVRRSHQQQQLADGADQNTQREPTPGTPHLQCA